MKNIKRGDEVFVLDDPRVGKCKVLEKTRKKACTLKSKNNPRVLTRHVLKLISR